MRYVSLFSGIEAATCAWEPLGWEPVAFSEIDPFCCELLKQRYPSVPNLGDITKVDWKKERGNFGRIDIIIGGSPCQSFSIAGGRTSLEGESGLMFEYIRAIRDVRPSWFIWENVPGALTAKGLHGEPGGAFGQLLSEMDKLGYGLAWRCLDAQFFGVAQRRERVFLVGHLGDMRAAAVLFDEEGLRGDPKPSREKRKELVAALGRGDHGVHASTLKLRHTGSAMPSGKSGGVGPLIQEELSATLGTSNDQTLICNQPAVCLQTDHLSQNGTNETMELCKTLDTQAPPAVVCMADDNAKAAIDENLCGVLKVGGSAPIIAKSE